MKVLLIEDDLQERAILTEILRNDEYEVMECDSAEMGLEYFYQEHYPLILVDVGLPGMDGLSFCREIRQTAEGKYVVILVVTANIRPENLQLALEAGADDYLTKPLDIQLLRVRLTIAKQFVYTRTQQKKIEKEIQDAYNNLEQRVKERTSELQNEVTKRKSIEEELRVHQIELEVQNAELREAQVQLEISRDNYINLYDFAPTGYFTFDKNGLILNANLTGADLLERPREQLINRPLTIFLASESLTTFYMHCQHVLESRKSDVCELKLIRRRGEAFYVQMESVAAEDENGRYLHLRSTILDITDRKRIENLLRLQYGLAMAVSSSRDLKYVLHRLLEATFQIESIDCGGIYLVDKNTGDLYLMVHNGFSSDEFVKSVSRFHADSPQVNLLKTKKFIYKPSDKSFSELEDVRQNEQLRAVISIPVEHDGRMIAVLNLASHTHNELSENEQNALLGIATQAGDVLARIESMEALRESQREYEELVNSVDGIVWKADPKTFQFTFVSQQAERLLGYSTNQWTNDPMFWLNHLHPDDREWAPTFCQKMTSEKRDHEFEYRMITADGRFIWLRDIVTVIVENGKPTRLQGVMIDVTHSKRAEEDLRESEEKFRRIAETSADFIYQIDKNGLLTYCSPAVLDILGFSPEEVVGTHFYSYFPPHEIPKVTEAFQQVMRGENVELLDLEVLSKEKEIVLIETTITSIMKKEEVIGLQGIGRDVTERRQVERELQNSKQFIESIINTIPNFLYIYDLIEDRNVYANEGLLSIIGYTPAELQTMKNRAIPELIHPDDVGRVQKAIQNLIKDKEARAFESEYRLKHKDGSWRWVYDRARVFKRTKEETVRQLIGSVIDITRRKQVEEALHYRLEFEKIISDISTNFINIDADQIDAEITNTLGVIGILADVDRCYLFLISQDGQRMSNTHEWCAEGVKPEIQNLQSLPVDEFKWAMSRLKNFEPLFIPNIADLPPEAVFEKEHYQTQGIQSMVVVPVTYGNHLIGFLGFDSVHNIRSWIEEDIILLKTVGEVFVNALRHKETEEALKKEKETFFSILEEAPYGVIFLEDDQIVYLNPKSMSILGYTLADIPTDEVAFEQFYPDVKYRENVYQRWYNAIENNENNIVEVLDVICKDGTVKEIEFRPTFLQNHQVVMTISDVTERNRSEAALKKAHQELSQKAIELEEANEELTQFAYVASHDLKAPLRAVHNYADFLLEDLEDTLDEEQTTYLHGLGRAVREAEALVNDLLELSRIGRDEVPTEQIDMKRLIQDIITSFDIDEDTEVIVADDLPVIEGEITYLRQIFSNLISNALKFNKSLPKRVEIGYHCCLESDDLEWHEFFVRDNGIGIDPRYHQKIFWVFQRLHTTREYEGTGVGLAIIKKALSKMHGSIRVKSELDKGSTFFVKLPFITNQDD